MHGFKNKTKMVLILYFMIKNYFVHFSLNLEIWSKNEKLPGGLVRRNLRFAQGLFKGYYM